jgi:hypothetical protein
MKYLIRLCRGLEERGGRLLLNSHVERILLFCMESLMPHHKAQPANQYER